MIGSYSGKLLSALLRSCVRRPWPLIHGQILHANFLKVGFFPSHPSVSNALFHMYAAVGLPSEALLAFRHHVTSPTTLDFTALLSAYLRSSLPYETLRIFFFSHSNNSCPLPDGVTMTVVFTAAAKLTDLTSGILAHLIVVKRGVVLGVVARNSAMDMYVKCAAMVDARKMFDEIEESERSVVSWSVLLWGVLKWDGLICGKEVFDKMAMKNQVAWSLMASAYIENGLPKKAMEILTEMAGVSDDNLNHISVCSLLSACALVGDVTVVRWVHAYVVKVRMLVLNQEHDDWDNDASIMVGSSLIDVYAKCGRIEIARRLFEKMAVKNIVTWNTMLSGLALHGLVNETERLFSQMITNQIVPDDISFVGLLSAYSRSGHMKSDWKCFHKLMTDHGVTPKMEHYACIVDGLGRAGRLVEAEALVKEMPFRPNEVILGSLISSCCLYGKVEMGRRMMEELLHLDPHNTEYHILMSNMYASSGNQCKANNLRQGLKNRGFRKVPGVSYISIDRCIHRFSAGDKSHPQTPEVYAMLDEMIFRLSSATGYPTSPTTRDAEEEEREEALFSHSERLALAFGLISTKPGTPLHIFKNIRICRNCHSVIKLVSDLYQREITVRDRNRFHSFKLGFCSCLDYW